VLNVHEEAIGTDGGHHSQMVPGLNALTEPQTTIGRRSRIAARFENDESNGEVYDGNRSADDEIVMRLSDRSLAYDVGSATHRVDQSLSATCTGKQTQLVKRDKDFVTERGSLPNSSVLFEGLKLVKPAQLLTPADFEHSMSQRNRLEKDTLYDDTGYALSRVSPPTTPLEPDANTIARLAAERRQREQLLEKRRQELDWEMACQEQQKELEKVHEQSIADARANRTLFADNKPSGGESMGTRTELRSVSSQVVPNPVPDGYASRETGVLDDYRRKAEEWAREAELLKERLCLMEQKCDLLKKATLVVECEGPVPLHDYNSVLLYKRAIKPRLVT
jgi:hypothetical protein